MYRKRSFIKSRKVIIGVSAAVLAAGAFAISTGVSSAGENCIGLDQALRNNLNFMADQVAHPTAQTPAILANRQAVVDLINQRRQVAGCTAKVTATSGGTGAAAPAAPAAKPTTAKPTTAAPTTAAPAAAGGTATGRVVCKGNTVTLSGEAGAPAASSGTFPIGTVLKVTNLDNKKSITVKVTEPSGSCALLNNAAFEKVREPGKFLIRHAVIEKVG